jgi:hypothetical protein
VQCECCTACGVQVRSQMCMCTRVCEWHVLQVRAVANVLAVVTTASTATNIKAKKQKDSAAPMITTTCLLLLLLLRECGMYRYAQKGRSLCIK